MKKIWISAVAAALFFVTGCQCGEVASVPQDSAPVSSVQSQVSVASSVESVVQQSSAAAGKTDDELLLAYDQTLRQTFKGLEIYCWSSDGTVLCGILPGTNRVKTAADFEYLYANPATPQQMSKLVGKLDKESTYLFVLPIGQGESTAVEAVRSALSPLGFLNLSAPSTMEFSRQQVSVQLENAVTEDWTSYEYEGDDLYRVTALFPEIFKQDFEDATTFSNIRTGIKAAEFFPVIKLSEGQKPYDRAAAEYDGTVISQEYFTLGENSGVCQVLKTSPSGGDVTVWYAHTYWVVKEQYAVGLTLYSLESGDADKALFDEIVKSIQVSEIE